MRLVKLLLATILGLILTTHNSLAVTTAPIVNPYANSSIELPPSYKGPTFQLSYRYPQQPQKPIENPPWIQALGGKPISQDNAIAYVNALKKYIGDDMRTLVLDYGNWNAEKAGWYNLPWLFSLRDPIHGTYVGSQFDKSMFPLSGLKKDMNTDVLVYYNDVAAYTLGQIWGKDALNPDLTKAQFPEGSIVIKVALTTALEKDWSPLKGAAQWQLYAPPAGSPDGTPPSFFNTSFFQFDIIVKDTKTAPKTGWVFATLTYDTTAKGDAWDQMVPLGAMWGNDPDINSAINPNAILNENVSNPLGLLYAVETLGYGGRLSGPNDGAVIQNSTYIDGQKVARARVSSCMSCHGVAEWPMKSFLLPGVLKPGQAPLFYKPGSDSFNRWFQDRDGKTPQDKGTIALDYDMNLAYKALRLWDTYTKKQPDRNVFLQAIPGDINTLLPEPARAAYNGLPIKVKK